MRLRLTEKKMIAEYVCKLKLEGLNINTFRPGAHIGLQTVLDAIEKAGAWVSYECKRGECRKCVLEYSGGEVEHQDVCLSPESRRTIMCPCVSRPRGTELKLNV